MTDVRPWRHILLILWNQRSSSQLLLKFSTDFHILFLCNLVQITNPSLFPELRFLNIMLSQAYSSVSGSTYRFSTEIHVRVMKLDSRCLSYSQFDSVALLHSPFSVSRNEAFTSRGTASMLTRREECSHHLMRSVRYETPRRHRVPFFPSLRTLPLRYALLHRFNAAVPRKQFASDTNHARIRVSSRAK